MKIGYSIFNIGYSILNLNFAEFVIPISNLDVDTRRLDIIMTLLLVIMHSKNGSYFAVMRWSFPSFPKTATLLNIAWRMMNEKALWICNNNIIIIILLLYLLAIMFWWSVVVYQPVFSSMIMLNVDDVVSCVPNSGEWINQSIVLFLCAEDYIIILLYYYVLVGSIPASIQQYDRHVLECWWCRVVCSKLWWMNQSINQSIVLFLCAEDSSSKWVNNDS